MKRRKRIVILGSTGSIGTQTLDVVREHPDRFEIFGLACRSNYDLLVQQIQEFRPQVACVRDRDLTIEPRTTTTEMLPYPEGMTTMAGLPEADIVVVATVGEAGFWPTERALRVGNTVALASKEILVMGGGLFRELADSTNASILPIDSEHSAIWQCLAGESPDNVRRLILTASGGPFRTNPISQIRSATSIEALQHPNWDMGSKITIDSASLLNKGFEIIEAHWLFGVKYEDIDVTIHPQSIIHSMVEFHDGSLKAQLGTPDMHQPIKYALGYPERLLGTRSPLDVRQLSKLTFEPPDEHRFPLLATARDAGQMGGTAPATLCGADDAATTWFLKGGRSFGQMTDAVQSAMDALPPTKLDDVASVLMAYKRGFDFVKTHLSAA